MTQRKNQKSHPKKDLGRSMQRYRHYGASYSSSAASSRPVEEVQAQEEEEEEEEEEVVYVEEVVYEEEVMQEEEQVAGGAEEEQEEQEEEVPQMKEEVQPVEGAEGKTSAAESKNGKKVEKGGGDAGGGPKHSMFTWFMVLALLGVWSSVAVVYFDIVDYDSVVARAKDFQLNFSQVLQGKLTAYDTDGDGDFDVEDAKVLLDESSGQTATGHNRTRGLKEPQRGGGASRQEKAAEQTSRRSTEATNQQAAEPQGAEPSEATLSEELKSADVSLPPAVEDEFVPDDPRDSAHPHDDKVDVIDTTGVLLEEPKPLESGAEPGPDATSSRFTQEAEPESEPGPEPVVEPEPEPAPGPEPAAELEPAPKEAESSPDPDAGNQSEEKLREKAKKKKPKLLNKFDKTIKAEIDAAEKLRKKGKLEEALRAFEALVQQHPQSPRARYGKAQTEDDLAEKMRSNDLLQKAINTYREAAELPDATSDLLRAALKRRAERQQFLGRMRGSMATLQRLTQLFPDDIALKNDLGVAHLLLGDNQGAKQVYEEVLTVAPGNGFAKVHYGFILKSENKIAESIPYLKEGLETGEPGTDDGRFYFHLGDALQRVGDKSAYYWYELGHQRGHFASVWQRSLYNVDGLKAQPWWTPKDTGYTDLVKTLERNWKTIRDEALAVMDQDTGMFVPEEENLREKGEWGQYTLWQQGRKVGNSCQGVPKTCALLDRFPEATGCKRGQIKFSVMQPGTHVWPHTGPTNCRLRMHLGLVIPKQGCRIRCTDQTREWEEGKVLIFDDSFEHEVWQDADSYRLIFIVDVWHPELTAKQRQTLSPI